MIVPKSAGFTGKTSDVVITLEPGLAFGTGHHPTTRMCLEEIETTVKPNDRFLDVGCGSGVLSIAALALGAQHAIGVDIENDAVNAAIRNLNDAGFSAQSTILSGELPQDKITDGDFDVVVANIAANVLIKNAESLIAAAAEDGVIIASGMLKTRVDDVVSAFESAGGKVQSTRQIEDWITTLITRSK
jgi:ribosomal protein L11 methyltransferase